MKGKPMASGGMGSILKIAAIGGLAYYVYEYFSAPAAVTAGSTATGGTTPATSSAAAPAVVSTPAASGLVAELQNAAKDNGFLAAGFDAYQWNWYRNQLHPPDLTPEQFGLAFPDPSAKLTASAFVAALQGKGLGALPKRLFMPMLLQVGKQSVLVMPKGPGRSEVNAEAANRYYAGARR